MRTLAIGTDISFVTESRLWTEDYNLKDYRATFANLRDIETTENIMTPDSTPDLSVQFPSQGHILQSLKNGNNLFVILPTEREINLDHISSEGHQGSKLVDLLDWLPFELTLEINSGESVGPDSILEGWSWYFSEPFQREYTIKSTRKQKPEESSASQVLTDLLLRENPNSIPLAETISGESIGVAVDLTPLQQQIANQNTDNPERWGRVYLIPSEQSTSVSALVKGILRNIYNQDLDDNRDRPEWVADATLQCENEIIESIQRKRQRLQRIKRFKELWWATGDRLEDRVVEAFQLLGASVSDIPESGLWDGLVEYDGTVYVLEVSGSSETFSIEKTRQLQDWVSRVDGERPADDVTGLLIGNPNRDAPPNDREKPLTEAAVQHMSQNEYLYLDSGELLGFVLGTIRQEESADVILDELFDSLSIPSID